MPNPASASRAAQRDQVDRRLIGQLGSAKRALAVSIAVGVVTTATVIAQMLLVAHLIGWAMASHPGPVPVNLILGLVIALVARTVAVTGGEAMATASGAAVTAELRSQMLDALVRRGPVDLVSERTGALTVAATRGLRSLEPYFGRYLPAAVVSALAPPVALVTLAILDWPSALIALALVAVVPFAMIRLGRRAAAESERQWRRLSSMSGRYLELLRGIPTLRALGRVQRGRDEVVAANEAVSASVDATLRAAMLSSAALEFLAGVGVGLVAMLAGLRLLHGDFAVDSALAVILVTPEVFLPLRRAGAEFHASTEGRAAARSVFAAIDAVDHARHLGSSIPADILPVVLDEVSVSYGGPPVLVELSLVLASREHLIIDGPSGAGKTTLLGLVGGFITPTSGRLAIGGVEASELDWRAARRHISLVPQDPHVFSWSLRDNLSLGLEIAEERLEDALEAVGLSHLAAPEVGGLDRALAEAGRSISAGERQRLGLARALVQDRPLVLLDEPTAHLDEATTERLRAQLGPWLAERAVIEVTHRSGLLGPEAARLHLTRAQP